MSNPTTEKRLSRYFCTGVLSIVGFAAVAEWHFKWVPPWLALAIFIGVAAGAWMWFAPWWGTWDD